MVVWIASFPRAGNTFFRILINRLYGWHTYTDYTSGDDLTIDGVEGNLTGYQPWPTATLDTPRRWGGRTTRLKDWHELDAEDEVYFIKSHGLVSQVPAGQRVILLIRDGRDSLVSLAWYRINVVLTWHRYRAFLKYRLRQAWRPSIAWTLAQRTRDLIYLRRGDRTVRAEALYQREIRKLVRSASWGQFNAGWLARPAYCTAQVRFEDLIAQPRESIARALEQLGVRPPESIGDVPSFDELKRAHPHFFRAGQCGQWRTDFPPDLEAEFWRLQGPIMRRLGYTDGAPGGDVRWSPMGEGVREYRPLL
jgi:hypothetical protein